MLPYDIKGVGADAHDEPREAEGRGTAEGAGSARPQLQAPWIDL